MGRRIVHVAAVEFGPREVVVPAILALSCLVGSTANSSLVSKL